MSIQFQLFTERESRRWVALSAYYRNGNLFNLNLFISDHRFSVMHLFRGNILNQQELITLFTKIPGPKTVSSSCQVDSPIDTTS